MKQGCDNEPQNNRRSSAGPSKSEAHRYQNRDPKGHCDRHRRVPEVKVVWKNPILLKFPSQSILLLKKLLQVSSRSQISGLDLSVGSEIKKELKNTSGQTYVKDDFANLDDFEAKPITSPKMRVHSTYLLHCLSFVLT